MTTTRYLLVMELDPSEGKAVEAVLRDLRKTRPGFRLSRATPADIGSLAEKVEFVFDHQEAKGTVTVERGNYGTELLVNGIRLGVIDLLPTTPQLVIDYPTEDEMMAKLIVEKDRRTLVVCGTDPKWVLRGDGRDMYFVAG